jgi:hypothetical protein
VAHAMGGKGTRKRERDRHRRVMTTTVGYRG